MNINITHEKLPTVLIVDDDPAVVLTMGKALQGIADIYFACTGQEALDRFAQKIPQLILLDMEMPGMNGLEVLTQLKAIAQRKHPQNTEAIPVIFITANADPAFEETVFEAGAADYIAKPLSPRVVVARVKAQLALADALGRLRELVIRDSLTGLYNRRAFDERLLQEWARVQRHGGELAVMMVDVDHFKKYNDQFGHPMGDLCLREVAASMQTVCRRAGDFVARLGGEEFAILLTDTSIEEVDTLAQTLCKSIEALQIPHADAAGQPWVTVSVGYCGGVVPAGVSGISASRLLDEADKAMYRAKRMGRNQVVAHPLSDVGESLP